MSSNQYVVGSKPVEKRPRNIKNINSVATCEKHRQSVIKDLSKKINKIQSAQLPDYQVRDLNDAINQLMREKHAWEIQIRDLGGINYIYSKAKLFADDGEKIGEIDDYRYYGRARELPGVKELFEADMTFVPERLRKQEMQQRQLDAWYYGYTPLEEEASLQDYEKTISDQRMERLSQERTHSLENWKPIVIEHIPAREEVERILLERRKNALLHRLV
ncbi:complexed with Cdc5 protein Cwf12 [Schizosaccharomyces cryophilus OY26]|uniref:Complexed with Cdc5 protein Cwf12 n=1 Tax=Schizosaccharomyces cryophilus (strain OY26 / ATCC MYA-4695 / CBS 11777 / NBRC 106824 / NRRL Y48691) TaxID=653667 RepID=S9VUY9_SCHCR|nr:complexed with Cdc5 protein Cwf12 [Schizosaccharomyces cryophilus OY26]EPY51608.1 complexed with Cdc5 protein Cwf12 [Schizosaccharomyces cryophilus OY26]